MMRPGKIFILSGPSGSGKTTLYKKLLVSKKLKGTLVKSISATTRAKRLGEENGRDYLFLSLEDFREKIEQEHFLEWQKVFDNYYGTPKKNVETLLQSGKNVLLCIDVKGGRVVKRFFPGAVKIFVKAPSLAVLKERLLDRGSESQEDVEMRLETARKELLEAKKYEYVITNDNLNLSFRKLESIVLKELREI